MLKLLRDGTGQLDPTQNKAYHEVVYGLGLRV